MAKFAVVAPLNIVEQLDILGILGSHHLLLAHDVVHPRNNQRYHDLFHPEGRRRTKRDPIPPLKRTIIMDNSVIELGHAVDPAMLEEACSTVQATSVVLPDILEDAAATLESCVNAVLSWDKFDLPPYMMVPQGRTLSEFLNCAQAFIHVDRVNYWGVPRNIVALHGSRKGAIGCLFGISPGKRIHMMGFSDDIEDDIRCAQLTEVDTIDSAVPLRANTLITIDPEDPYKHTPRSEWWSTAEFHSVIPENLHRVRKWLDGHGATQCTPHPHLRFL